MESTQKEKGRIKSLEEPKHPLDRKFSSIEEAGLAKIEYIISTKPASFWEKLRKFGEEELR